MINLAEKVYSTGEARPSEIVSNYLTILVLRRNFIAAVLLMIIIVLVCRYWRFVIKPVSAASDGGFLGA